MAERDVSDPECWKAVVGGVGEVVGDEHLFCEAHEEPGEAERDVRRLQGEAATGRVRVQRA